MDLDLAREYLKSGVFQFEKIEALIQNIKSCQSPDIYAQSASEIWCDALSLNPDFLEISNQEVNALTDYLYIVELIIRCKESAVRVSPTLWEGIESRILTVPTD
jgi:hypothetical protein